MRTARIVLIFWLPLVAWFLVIHALSATPGSDIPHADIPNADKVFHVALYFVLGALLIRALDHSTELMIDIRAGKDIDRSGSHVSLAKLAVLAIIVASCYGGLDELFQRTVPDRSCDLFDFIADCAGSLIGIFAYIVGNKKIGGNLAADKTI